MLKICLTSSTVTPRLSEVQMLPNRVTLEGLGIPQKIHRQAIFQCPRMDFWNFVKFFRILNTE